VDVLIVGALILVAVLVLGASLTLLRRRGPRPSGRSEEVPGEAAGGPVGGASADEPSVAQPSTTQPAVTRPPITRPPVAGQDPEPAAEEADASAARPPDRPAPTAGRLRGLRSRLARSNGALGQGLLTLLSRAAIDEQTWDEVEEVLLAGDLGVGPTADLLERLRARVRVDGVRDPQQVREMLRAELLALVDPGLDRSLAVNRPGDRPAVVLVVGVNGTGKTTTVGKLARVLVADDQDVVLGAADTFRAAAADQLQTWGARVGVPTVRSDRDGADPAAVAFDAVRAATDGGADVVLIDTAGRLQNKAGLMDELGKVKRVIEKQSPVDEVLLVLDATTGQNGMRQAQVFAEVVAVTGIVLTKLDGTAKGGIVVAVQRELGVPVKLVGLGEGPDDLAPFDPAEFVDALLA
jgi:fused signal recognition particle receptor